MEYKNTETNNDRWIVEHVFPDEYGKYFVEVGAANGINASSCYVLEKHLQWTGRVHPSYAMSINTLPRNNPI